MRLVFNKLSHVATQNNRVRTPAPVVPLVSWHCTRVQHPHVHRPRVEGQGPRSRVPLGTVQWGQAGQTSAAVGFVAWLEMARAFERLQHPLVTRQPLVTTTRTSQPPILRHLGAQYGTTTPSNFPCSLMMCSVLAQKRTAFGFCYTFSLRKGGETNEKPRLRSQLWIRWPGDVLSKLFRRYYRRYHSHMGIQK